MTLDLIQFLIFGTLLLLAAWPLGHYMARVFTGEVQFLASVEHALLRLAGQATPQPQRWQVYALSLLAFNAAGFALLFRSSSSTRTGR